MREEAEFCIEDAGGMFLASTQGQRDEAWREIQHYAAQYAGEGPLTIYEVTRKVVTDAGEQALRIAGATGPLGDPEVSGDGEAIPERFKAGFAKASMTAGEAYAAFGHLGGAEAPAPLWQAINEWFDACIALAKRRASGELMNADYIDAANAAEQRINSIARGVMGTPPNVDDLMELARVYAHAYFNHHTGSRDGMLEKTQDTLRATLSAGVTGTPAHSKSEYKRRVAQGDQNVLPPAGVTACPIDHVGESNFEGWFASYDPAGKGDKQRARDAYAAGMGEQATHLAGVKGPDHG